MKTLDSDELDLLHDLFGGPCRIILAAFAWQRAPDAFNQTEAKVATRLAGGSMTQAQRDLAVLCKHGLLQCSKGPKRNDELKYGVVKDHAMWSPLLATAELLGLIEGDAVGHG